MASGVLSGRTLWETDSICWNKGLTSFSGTCAHSPTSCITRVYQVHTDGCERVLRCSVGIFLTAASSSMMVWQWSAMVWEAYPWRIIQMTSSEPLWIRALIPLTVSDIFQSWIQLRTSGTHFFTRMPAKSPPSLSHFLWIAAYLSTCPVFWLYLF